MTMLMKIPACLPAGISSREHRLPGGTNRGWTSALLLLLLGFSIVTNAKPTSFEWSSTSGYLVSRDRALIETVTGQVAFEVDAFWVVEGTINGDFTYDPENAEPPVFFGDFVQYRGANADASTSLAGPGGLIGTLSGGSGTVTLSDNGGGPSATDDVINFNHCCGDGFTVGEWRAVVGAVVWIGDGIQDGIDLPVTIPPEGAPLPLGLMGFFNPVTGANSQILAIDVSVREAVQSVEIDIKPGSEPNCFNINGHGVIPVAILGSDGFDVASVDQSTLRFGGLAVRVRGNRNPQCSVEDSNADGHADLVCQFEDDADMWEAGDGEATLTGELLDGSAIRGADSICLVP